LTFKWKGYLVTLNCCSFQKHFKVLIIWTLPWWRMAVELPTESRNWTDPISGQIRLISLMWTGDFFSITGIKGVTESMNDW